MKLSITINGREHTLELLRNNGVSYRLDDAPFDADVAEVAHGVYSLLIGGKSFTVRVAPAAVDGAEATTGEYSVDVSGIPYAVSVRDRRRPARGGGAKPQLEGKQNVVARMPGKVVRLLVSEGEKVESGQGLVVVEAMKMQNEIKCPKPGKIQKILVREGQAVNAGEILLAVE